MAVEVRDDAASGWERLARDCGERILALCDVVQCELGIVLTDDRAIRELNREYRSKDRPTDVLAFPLLEPEFVSAMAPTAFPLLLGDVVVSVETARRQAEAGGWLPEEEIARLLVHGVLHVLGYDHENGGAEAERMWAEERRIAQALVAAGIPCAWEAPG
jgi:rRNA maturation RNase YbeY